MHNQRRDILGFLLLSFCANVYSGLNFNVTQIHIYNQLVSHEELRCL